MNVEVNIRDEAGPALVRIQTGLRNRQALHAQIARDGENFLKTYGRTISAEHHRTASRLGAKPTNHLLNAYQAIESEGKPELAELRIPRASRLRAAFGDYVVRPGSGKTYLTIPDHADVYGRRVREFPEGTFRFAILHAHRVFPVLLFAAAGGRHKAGDVAYWLRRELTIQADTTLIRFDLLAEEARDSVEEYIDTLRRGGEA